MLNDCASLSIESPNLSKILPSHAKFVVLKLVDLAPVIQLQYCNSNECHAREPSKLSALNFQESKLSESKFMNGGKSKEIPWIKSPNKEALGNHLIGKILFYMAYNL